MRVYIDTSVVGGCLDDEFAEESKAIFEMARSGVIRLLISNVLADELILAPFEVQKTIADLPEKATEIVHESKESRALRDEYLKVGVVGPAHSNDAHHVAIATVCDADMIVSWNFKHIVHYDKIRLFNAVNRKMSYRTIEIYSPLEVV